MLETLTKEIWTDCLNEGFIIAGSIELELVEVNSLSHKHPRAEREPFSLVFRGPKAPLLIQKIYPVEHRSLIYFWYRSASTGRACATRRFLPESL